MAETGKEFDIRVWEEFCAKIKAKGHSSYFEDLLDSEGLVAANIRGDYPPFVRITVSHEEWSELKAHDEMLQREIDGLHEFDIRVLRARERELAEAAEQNLKVATAIAEQTHAVKLLIETGEEVIKDGQ